MRFGFITEQRHRLGVFSTALWFYICIYIYICDEAEDDKKMTITLLRMVTITKAEIKNNRTFMSLSYLILNLKMYFSKMFTELQGGRSVY